MAIRPYGTGVTGLARAGILAPRRATGLAIRCAMIHHIVAAVEMYQWFRSGMRGKVEPEDRRREAMLCAQALKAIPA